MEISIGNETMTGTLRNENITSRQNSIAPTQTHDQTVDTISSNIRSSMKSKDVDPDQLLEQTVEASAQNGGINEAHDFDLARVMKLLSDPLLQEDIPD